MAREYEQLKATVATLQMFQHEGEKAITPLTGSEYTHPLTLPTSILPTLALSVESVVGGICDAFAGPEILKG